MPNEWVTPEPDVESAFWASVGEVEVLHRDDTVEAVEALSVLEDPSLDEYWQVAAHLLTYRVLIDAIRERGLDGTQALAVYRRVRGEVNQACATHESQDEAAMMRVVEAAGVTPTASVRLYCVLGGVHLLEPTLLVRPSLDTVHKKLTAMRLTSACAYQCCLDLARPLKRLGSPLVPSLETTMQCFPSAQCQGALSVMGVRGPSVTLSRAMREMGAQAQVRIGGRLSLADMERLLSIFYVRLKAREMCQQGS